MSRQSDAAICESRLRVTVTTASGKFRRLVCGRLTGERLTQLRREAREIGGKCEVEKIPEPKRPVWTWAQRHQIGKAA